MHFDEDFLFDCRYVLCYIYRTALSWGYNPEIPFPKDDVEQMLKHFKNVDYKSFDGVFYLWRFVSSCLPLPIPRLQIIPSVMSHWNAIKEGSDTITKLIWLNMYDPPSRSTQAQAIAKMLLFISVVIHCLNHICSSKAVDQYPSQRHFRVAASKHYSFHQMILSAVHAIRNQIFQPRPSVLSSPLLVNHGTCTRRIDASTKPVV